MMCLNPQDLSIMLVLNKKFLDINNYVILLN